MRSGASWSSLAFLLGGPLLMEVVAVTCIFHMLLTGALAGLPPKALACFPSVYAAGYIVSAWAAGRWVTWRSGWRLVFCGIFLQVMLATLVLHTRGFALHLGVAAAAGVVSGHYFAPFQVVMADVRPFRTLAWTIAAYNMSWGAGGTAGPLLSGWLPRLGTGGVLGIFWGCAAAHTVLALAARGAGRRDHGAGAPASAFSATPAMIRIGWLSGLAAALLQGGVLAIWPAYGAMAGLTDRQIAAGAMAVWGMIPLLAPLCALLRGRMRRPRLLLGSYALGAAALLGLTVAAGGLQLGLCLLALGVMLSSVYFHGIYYCNADAAARMKSVSVYEAIVGVGTLAGPAIMGGLAWNDATSVRPFLAGVLLLGGAAWVTRRIERPGRGNEPGPASPPAGRE